MNQPHGSYHFGVVQTKISGSYQEKVVFTSNAVRTTLLVQTTCSWFKPEIQVQTSQSGVNHEAGSYHLFLVCTGKVVQTRKQWYEPSVVQTTLGWSGPLFLVQTTKTWSIPIFFRLLRRVLSRHTGHTLFASRAEKRNAHATGTGLTDSHTSLLSFTLRD
jgi:hypothetical protein